MEIDIKQLEEACLQFYRSEVRDSQAQCHQWLQHAQNSFQAWSFCWDMMQMDKPCEIQFFGATTLHTKLMKGWNEVPVDMQDELKQKLLEAIVTYSGGSKLILNRLCISLSAFIVHTINDKWPNAIEDVISLYIPNVDKNMQVWIMFEILSGVPEMGTSIHMAVQRVVMRQQLSKKTILVMNCIEQYLSAKVETKLEETDMPVLLNAVKCVKEWITNSGLLLSDSIPVVIALLKLIKRCYWDGVSEGDGCMSADESDLACASLKALTNLMIQPDAHKYSNSALEIMKLFLEALSDITQAEWHENNLNEDIAFSIYTLLISSTECHSKVILAGVTSDSPTHCALYAQLVQEIMLCTNKPGIYPIDESCSSLGMGFWYMLQDEVSSIENLQSKVKCFEMIRPVYASLVSVLVRKSQLPSDCSRDRWCADDLETFRCYRQDIADTLLFCHEVLNQQILDILGALLDTAVEAVKVSYDNWMPLEAVIHGFCALAAQIDDDEGYHQISKLMVVLNQIPYENINEKVLGTSLETVGSFSEWLKMYPAFLESAINLLLTGLSSSMSSQATLGLKDLTTECQSLLKNCAEQYLVKCQQILLAGNLSNTEQVRLMYSIGKLMSLAADENIPNYLNAIVSPCFQELHVIVNTKDVSNSGRSRTIFRLNMVSTLFASLNTRRSDDIRNQQQQLQPILIVLKETMPILKETSNLWINDIQILETLCGAINHALVNLLDDIKPLLTDLCVLILGILQSKCVPPAIDIGATCIIMFCKDPDFDVVMRDLFVEILKTVFRVFDQTADNKLSDHADLIETFFNFNTKIVKRFSTVYANADCNKLINYALKGITLPEAGPIKRCAAFLATFIKTSRDEPNMTNVILEKGGEIISCLLLCIGCITPRVQIDVFADIFIGLNGKYPAEFIVWMKILNAPNFPTPLVNGEEKNVFMKAVIKEKVNKRLVQDHIRKFGARCRGIIENSSASQMRFQAI